MIVDFQHHFVPRALIPDGAADKQVTRYDEHGVPSYSFHRLLYDDAQMLEGQPIKLVKDENIRRVVLCSGKVYFDLYEEREARGIDDIYLMRVEQLYPFPMKALSDELVRFKSAEVLWCQEEPQNMGSWTFVEPRITAVLAMAGREGERPRYAGRAASAATATGLMSKHESQRRQLLEDALGD